MTPHIGPCEAGDNPRDQSACRKCGKTLPPPPAPVPVRDLCDPEFETQATITAARQAGVDGRALNAFAVARKLPGPVLEHGTRDLTQDVLEELADARNYAVWKLEQAQANGTLTVEQQWHLMQGLGMVAAAWHHFAQADDC